MRNYNFIRNLEAEDLLENFLVSAVVSLLSIRFYLSLTHYPTLGHGSFHIAHMLWGGLFMLVGIIILLSFLNRPMMRVAAIVGGIGFGAFIDELGKFITSDNNYFFKPTIALIYVVFVLIYLSIKALPRFRKISETEYLINAIEMTKEAIINDLDHEEKQLALSYLSKSHQHSPITKALTSLLIELDTIPPPPLNITTLLRKWIRETYNWLLASQWFLITIVIAIVFQAMGSLLTTFYFVAELNKYFFMALASIFLALSFYTTKHYSPLVRVLLYLALLALLVSIFAFSAMDPELPTLPFYEWGRLIASGLSALFAIKGLYEIRFSRLQAYKSFKQSILISIFLTQFFVFYQIQFFALFGFLINILMHVTMQYMIQKEAHRRVSS
ncbi:hypothetical protein BH11PAT1_BH11PAT1_4660 [soil metagenome]